MTQQGTTGHDTAHHMSLMIWHLTWAHRGQRLFTGEDNQGQPSNLTAPRVSQVTLSIPQYISDGFASNMGAIKGNHYSQGMIAHVNYSI